MIRSIDPIPFAIPFFILAILIEIAWTQHTHKNQYRLNDTLTCLSASIMSSLTGLAGTALISFCYLWIYRHHRLTDMQSFAESSQTLLWFSLVIIQDFIYYWFHRVSHRVNLLWGAHIAHHSSEEYNLAVALRQSSFQQFFSWPFYLPLALLGFPPAWLLSVIGFNLIYQFWFHTREIDRMPAWFEAVLNTPSHHRVHHGVNPEYLDKNYGGIFIIWDKWFGTFEPEVTPVKYGITVPLNNYNPIWVNVHYYWYLIETSRNAPNLNDALLLWLMPPDWKPEWLNLNEPSLLI